LTGSPPPKRLLDSATHRGASGSSSISSALSPAAVATILEDEGFGKLPRRRDEERPDHPRRTVADSADVRQVNLSPRHFRTKFGGLFLFLPYLVSADLDTILARCGFPGSKMVPAACAMRSLLALELFGSARHGHDIGNGYEIAKSRHLFRDFVDASAGVEINDEEIVVRIQKRAHNPLLVAAECDKTDIAVPWLGGKRVKMVFG
jgi:hypothetical protein